jgi:cytochrome P450
VHSRTELIDELWGSVFASIDSVNSALMNTLYLLSKYTKIQENIFEENKQVLSDLK